MPDTAETTQAAGQPDDDAAAQQALADALAQPEPQDGEDQAPSEPADPWADPEVARKEIEKLRRQAAGYRTKLRDAEPQLAEYQQVPRQPKNRAAKTRRSQGRGRKGPGRSAVRERPADGRGDARNPGRADRPARHRDGGRDRGESQAPRRTPRRGARTAAERPASIRPVESLTAGGRPADDTRPWTWTRTCVAWPGAAEPLYPAATGRPKGTRGRCTP